MAGYNFEPNHPPALSLTSFPDVALTMADLRLHSALQQIARGFPLSRAEAAAAFSAVMSGQATAAQAAGLLMGLRARGETADEVIGAAQALRCAMVQLDVEGAERLVDTCGTGGGRVGTVNISTAAAFIVAGAGVPVAKHGNRSYTSKSGSADVLEALGVNVSLEPSRAAQVLRAAGIVFLFAPVYHPAMRHLGAVRKELGVPTIMNLLGPLVNPAGVTRQVIGVADASRGPLIAAALAGLDTRHGLVLHADVGMDEISPSGCTSVWEVEQGSVKRWELNPASYGLSCEDLEGLAGGEPQQNAVAIERLLEGEGNPPIRCAVLLNAAAALYVSGNGWNVEQAVERSREALDSGAAAKVLGRLRAAAPAITQ